MKNILSIVFGLGVIFYSSLVVAKTMDVIDKVTGEKIRPLEVYTYSSLQTGLGPFMQGDNPTYDFHFDICNNCGLKENEIIGSPKNKHEVAEYIAEREKRKNTFKDSILVQDSEINPRVQKTAAAMSSLSYEDKLRVETELNEQGFELVEFYDDDRYNQNNQFFIARKIIDGKEKYVIAIRGTKEPTDYWRDANADGYDLSKDGVRGKVHEGFGSLAQAVRYNDNVKEVIQKLKSGEADLLITGHSLGGAGATIFTAMLQGEEVPSESFQTYTFGAPPGGDDDFIAYHDKGNIFRIRNEEDPVPYSAYGAGWKHIGKVYTYRNIGDNTYQYVEPEYYCSWNDIANDFKQKGLVNKTIGTVKTVYKLESAADKADNLINYHIDLLNPFTDSEDYYAHAMTGYLDITNQTYNSNLLNTVMKSSSDKNRNDSVVFAAESGIILPNSRKTDNGSKNDAGTFLIQPVKHLVSVDRLPPVTTLPDIKKLPPIKQLPKPQKLPW